MSARFSTKLDFLAPPLGVTYRVVVACHDTFNGQDDEFGHFEQDVRAHRRLRRPPRQRRSSHSEQLGHPLGR